MTEENQPREYNEDEVRAQFLRHVNELVRYWENEARKPDSLSKLEGLAFSIMSAIDGCAGDLPKYVLAPDPHPEDKEYNKSQRENYFPENHESGVKCDISGGLHELLQKYKTE